MDGRVQRVGEDVSPEVVHEDGTTAAERFEVGRLRPGPVGLGEAGSVAFGEAVGAEEVHRAFPLADQDYSAGDGRAGVDHAPGKIVHKVLGGPVQGKFAGDTRERRHALLEQVLGPHPLRNVVGDGD